MLFRSWATRCDVCQPWLPDWIWDGAWHLIQVHMKLDSDGTDGVVEAWMDGQKFVESIGVDLGSGGQEFFAEIRLSGNLNHNPDQDQRVMFGRQRVWITDPGWSN